MNMNRLSCLFLLFAVVILSPTETLGDDNCWDVLQSLPWEDETHDHDTTNMPNHPATSGTHTHKAVRRDIQIGNCQASEVKLDREHEVVDPDPPPPVVEGYKKPSLAICIAEPCFEDDRVQVLGPMDIYGNVPPEPEEGEPELFYPTIEIDGKLYWDSTRQPYQVSEEVENTETTPDGYRLEEINGQLLLVPYEDTLKHTPVDTFFEDPPEQDTFIIYTVVEVIGGKNYLKPTPFHAHPVGDPTDTGTGNQQSQETQDEQGVQGEKDIQEEQDSLAGVGETYASLDGKFYQVTSNPATPLQVTEYMVRTWGDGQDKLPQWIEIYNPNSLAVNLVGYEFSYVFKKQAHSIQLRHFLIPPEDTIILATHIPLQKWKYEGITESQVYNLKIENALKQGWSLKDPLGTIISETGKSFGQKENPIMPARVGLSRVSYSVYGSERTKVAYFFGFRKDVSTPGFQEPQIPRSPALLHQRMKTTWAAFKRKGHTP